MLKEGKILIGKNDNKEVYLLLNKANRHGLITGASGTGKTITLKVLAESFAEAKVPVFLVDIKGDLAGMSFKGNDDMKERAKSLNINDFETRSFKSEYYDIDGILGHKIKTTITDLGASFLSKLMDLNETQEDVLTIIFKIAKDNNIELNDLEDLRNFVKEVNEKRTEYSSMYGNLSTQSITSIQRNIVSLEETSANNFFGNPKFNIKDFMKYDSDTGSGVINILDATKLFNNSDAYVIVLLWLLTTIYNTMPEVGDLDKPKLVFFFDEAHLIFENMPNHIIKQVTQIVKLIRSKGIGVYFISQTPSDIPDEILGQLGNRIQHALRCYTASDEKVVKAAANSYRSNKEFDTFTVIQELKTGEALISVQDENGEPTVVERAKILPPQSRIGVISEDERNTLINSSVLKEKYKEVPKEEKEDEVKVSYVKERKSLADFEHKYLKSDDELIEKKEVKKSTKKSKLEKTGDKLVNKTVNSFGNQLGRKLFKKLFK